MLSYLFSVPILNLFSNPISFLFFTMALLVAITIHEFAHAWTADRLGDPTPRLQGRLTLNPFVHLDPIGTLMLLLIGFGWGKPVEFDPYNLKNPRRDAAIISLAGPVSNITLASILATILRFTSNPFSPYATISSIIEPFIFLNVALAVFNLIPIHPLDGGKILVGLLPQEEALNIDRFLNQYGMILLFFLILPIYNGESLISVMISPIINIILSIFIPGIKIV
jgi:Zn-dependent protease